MIIALGEKVFGALLVIAGGSSPKNGSGGRALPTVLVKRM